MGKLGDVVELRAFEGMHLRKALGLKRSSVCGQFAGENTNLVNSSPCGSRCSWKWKMTLDPDHDTGASARGGTSAEPADNFQRVQPRSVIELSQWNLGHSYVVMAIDVQVFARMARVRRCRNRRR